MTRGVSAEGPTEGDGLRLPCGYDATEVWDAATAPPGEHERGCPSCRAVRAERDDLDEASTAFLTDSGVPSAPTRLLGRVMRTVSSELRPGRPLPLRTDTGRAFVTDVAVGNALRHVLDDDPAFVSRRFSAESVEADHALRIWLSIAVSYEHFARHGDAEVRTRVVEAVRRLFDLRVESVEIDVVDVFADASSGVS